MIANQFTFDSGRKRNQTLITFSNGAQWKRIAAPTYVDGEPTYCHLVRLTVILQCCNDCVVCVYVYSESLDFLLTMLS